MMAAQNEPPSSFMNERTHETVSIEIIEEGCPDLQDPRIMTALWQENQQLQQENQQLQQEKAGFEARGKEKEKEFQKKEEDLQERERAHKYRYTADIMESKRREKELEARIKEMRKDMNL